MADEGDVLTNLDKDLAAGSNGADKLPSAGIITQYVKDLSVENPNAPGVYQWTEQPHIDLQFNIAANKVNDEVTEVELKVNVTAKTDKGNSYLIELVYCGLVGIRNVPEEQAHAFLFAEARRLAIESTLPPLGLPPLVDQPLSNSASASPPPCVFCFWTVSV